MAVIRPFRALRPRPDLAPRVAAVPYDVVNVEEARALASGSELSFLHVSRAEIDLPLETDPYSDAVYERARTNFDRLRSTALIEEPFPKLYFYRLRMGAHEQTGLAACYSIEEYNQGLVKKHEKTRPDKEDDRTRHVGCLRAQTGPVLLTYRPQPSIDVLRARVCAGVPLYDFIAEDGVAHTLWRAEPDTCEALIAAFDEVSELYIADGHHRAASAARAHTAMAATAEAAGEHAWFLAVAFPDDEVQILPYHRVVKSLSGMSETQFLEALAACGTLEPGGPSPSRRGQCTVYVGGSWHALTLRPSLTGSADPTTALDAAVLQETVLGPVLKIGDPRTDKGIDFVGGIRGPGELERLVRNGQAAAAFSMFPVSVAELMAVADAGAIMPPKSTWFEPKLRDGLLVHLI
ncbi:MAG: DUF1015 family protein [Luteitalea sp.]|nr:DUF1015 family protein [Luteitalea sp.]